MMVKRNEEAQRGHNFVKQNTVFSGNTTHSSGIGTGMEFLSTPKRFSITSTGD